MVCVYCGGKTRVFNSRPLFRSNQVWRRRICNECKAVFTTVEGHDPAQTWLVKSSNQSSTNFIREKLFLSIYESLKHRPTALLDAKHLTQTVINKLGAATKSGAIDASSITSTVIVSLNRFDKIAGTHYKAFHSS
ncbi:MAG: hypothetical protein ACREF7_00755 [Candidatus Saccharimonadales bacterium]